MFIDQILQLIQMSLQMPSYCEHFEYLKIGQSLSKQKQPACKYCFFGPINIWLCLSKGCSSYVCGKNNFEHLQSHLQQSRRMKKFHSIFINVATTQIKCIQCNIQIGDTDIPSNQKVKKKQEPFYFRAKLLPALNDLITHRIVGQLENSQGHRKISRGLVGLFASKYNYSINAAIQFLAHSKFIRDFVLQIKPAQSNKLLRGLKEVMRQIQIAEFRAIYSDAVSELLYKQFPKLYGYKRKDPFEIILYLFNIINDETRFYSIINQNGQDTDEWDLFYKKNTIKPNYIIYDVIQSTLSLNYQCLKCNKPSSVSHSIQFLKLSIPKKKRKTKQLEKQLASHRCESPLKNRRKSLLNVFKQEEFPITLVELIIQLMKSALHKEMNCQSCSQPLKKLKIHFQSLPDILIIQIARINKDGSVDETPVQLITESLDLGPFTNTPNQQILYDFETAVCIQKGCLFPVLVIGQFNRQKYVIRNEIVELSKQKLNPYLLCYKRRPSESSKQKLTEIRDDLQGKSQKKYVLPDFWLVQLENGIERQLKNTFVCRHNSLKPHIQTKMQSQTLVSGMVYQDLSHFYSNFKLNNNSFVKKQSPKSNESSPKRLQRWQQKQKLYIYDNQACYICSQQVEQLDFRRKKQREYVLMLDKLKAQNLPFCMISASWIKRWSNFLYNKETISYMPKGYPLPLSIDNKSLLEGNKCKPNLVRNEDYKVLNIYLWKFLKELYGGGPQIRYKWKQGRQSLDQEMLFDIKSKALDLKSIFSSKYIQSPKKLITSFSFIEKSSFIEEGNQPFLKPLPACQDLIEQQF